LLALTDETLARIAIASSRIPYKERRRWLKQIARRFKAPSQAALDQRDYRARQRIGSRMISIETTVAREENLVAAGLLNSQATDSREAVKAAIERLLDLLPTEVR
jgi:hypothetical protein